MASTRASQPPASIEPDVKLLLRRIMELLDENEEGNTRFQQPMGEGSAVTIQEVQSKGNPAGDGLAPEEIVLHVRLNKSRPSPKAVDANHPERHNLSPREQEIVRLVARGRPNKAIAAILEISPWTVSTHIRRIFAKLGVNSRSEMVACALALGISLE